MNDKKLKELIEFVKTTDLQEVAWEKKNSLVHFRRWSSAAPASVEATAAGTDFSEAAPPAPSNEAAVIRSTMVGTFYRADAAGHPPFVAEGTSVTAHQPVAAIEAMKIMKDVLAPNPCKILKVLVANGHAVEYGQPLFEVEPLQEENV